LHPTKAKVSAIKKNALNRMTGSISKGSRGQRGLAAKVPGPVRCRATSCPAGYFSSLPRGEALVARRAPMSSSLPARAGRARRACHGNGEHRNLGGWRRIVQRTNRAEPGATKPGMNDLDLHRQWASQLEKLGVENVRIWLASNTYIPK
jgi:hypothetical protein